MKEETDDGKEEENEKETEINFERGPEPLLHNSVDYM